VHQRWNVDGLCHVSFAGHFGGTFTFTGLPFTAGTAGTSYYVGVTANASTGYLVSARR